MGHLEEILWNVSQSTDKSSHMSYVRKQLPKLGGIFKCAGISGSMEAFFPDKCSNADKEMWEGLFLPGLWTKSSFMAFASC